MRGSFAPILCVPILCVAALLSACAPLRPDARAACEARGLTADSEGFRICLDAGGAAVATGLGSPFENADEEEGP